MVTRKVLEIMQIHGYQNFFNWSWNQKSQGGNVQISGNRLKWRYYIPNLRVHKGRILAGVIIITHQKSTKMLDK